MNHDDSLGQRFDLRKDGLDALKFLCERHCYTVHLLSTESKGLPPQSTSGMFQSKATLKINAHELTAIVTSQTYSCLNNIEDNALTHFNTIG